MPSTLKDSRACKPTRPMPRYISDGSGRDIIIAFSGDPLPPNFSHFSDHRPAHLPSKDKRSIAKVPAVPKFVPDGSGRDLFQQQNSDYVWPCKNKIRAEAVASKKNHTTNYNRPKANPKFVPSGSGRDMSYSDIDVFRTITSQNSFKVLRPSPSNAHILRPRTSPPPRFVSSGSGRDTFQNPCAHRPSTSYNPKLEGFSYGSQSISLNSRYKYGKPSRSKSAQNLAMKRLCISKKAASPSPHRTNISNPKPWNGNNISLDDYFR